MKTVVLPLCEKCGKPILDGTGVSVDGYIHILNTAHMLGKRLVGSVESPATYHVACLRGILAEVESIIARKNLQDTIDNVNKAFERIGTLTKPAVPEDKPGSWFGDNP